MNGKTIPMSQNESQQAVVRTRIPASKNGKEREKKEEYNVDNEDNVDNAKKEEKKTMRLETRTRRRTISTKPKQDKVKLHRRKEP